jgi:hypothetical protein
MEGGHLDLSDMLQHGLRLQGLLVDRFMHSVINTVFVIQTVTGVRL